MLTGLITQMHQEERQKVPQTLVANSTLSMKALSMPERLVKTTSPRTMMTLQLVDN
jgi:hypothetical protein